MLEVRRQAEVVAPPPENLVLDCYGRLSGDLERRKDLPAFPAMLRQPRPCHVPDPDLGRPVTSVRDEVDERSLGGAFSMFEGYLLLSRHELMPVRLRPGICRLPFQVGSTRPT
jgi:hypothetical protein